MTLKKGLEKPGGSPIAGEPRLFPKDVLLFLYEPGKRLVHVLVKLRNSPGALSDVAKRANEARLNILTGFTSVNPGEDSGIWSFFAELVDGSGPDEIRKALSGSKHVTGVVVNESTEGLLVDSMHFPLRMTPGRPIIALNGGTLRSMFRRVVSTFGSGGLVIVYQEGMEVGRQGGAYLKEIIGQKVLRQKVRMVASLLSAYGWGHVESMDVSPDLAEIRLRVGGCFEAAGERSLKPACHFTRGMLSGFFEEATGAPMESTEESCVAQGEPYCEFSLKRR